MLESSGTSTVESDISCDSDDVSEDEKLTPPSEAPSTSKPGSVESSLTQNTQSNRMAHRSPRSSPFSSPIPIRDSPQRGSLASPAFSSHSGSPPDADELTRALEMQFYKIELGEQKRLLGVMERHSMESGKVIQEAPGVRGFVGIAPPGMAPVARDEEDPAAAAVIGEEAISAFPYSITAGLEKGAKNR